MSKFLEQQGATQYFLMFDFELKHYRVTHIMTEPEELYCLVDTCLTSNFFYWSGQEVGVASVYISPTVIMKYLQCKF